MKYLFFLLTLLSAETLAAQGRFTKQLVLQKNGEGKVVLIQDAEIDEIVNTPKRSNTQKAKDKSPSSPSNKEKSNKENAPAERPAHDAGEGTTPSPTHRIRAIGYRIQVFTGSNSHQDKLKAQAIGEKCKKAFPMLSAYARFISPRWICRVGDFRTREDALEYAEKIRAARIADEVHVVRCEVLLRSRE